MVHLGRLACVAVCVIACTAHAQTQAPAVETGPGSNAGPVRLRQVPATDGRTTPASTQAFGAVQGAAKAALTPAEQEAARSEFERYIRRLTSNADIKRLGADWLNAAASQLGQDETGPLVPPDYLVRPGDELLVTMWGSVDADLRLIVDRSGRINIPRVGPVMVAGVRYAELGATINRRTALVFKNFELSVSLGQLRGVRVFVTGFVNRPGPVVVGSLSTVTQALAYAGGPTAAGSFRYVTLRRGNTVAAQFDLYDLLLKGDRSLDALVQPDDVIHVAAVGPQVAVVGSVNQPVIVELKPNEGLPEVLKMVGGYSATADTQRLAIERIDERATLRIQQITAAAFNTTKLVAGDIIRAFSAVETTTPTQRQNKRVRVEGEVLRPGEYVLPASSTLADAVKAAGGTTSVAYIYATELQRESVRITQRQNYERALLDFESQLVKAQSTRRIGVGEDANQLNAANSSNSRLVEQLRRLQPTGRIVLQLSTSSAELPEMLIEDADRLYIPPKPTTVGVFGSVFSGGSYLFNQGRTVGDYLRLAGGPTRGADSGSVFVIRANGAVASSLQESGFFATGNQLSTFPIDPGDTIFVPEELDKSTWTQNVKDWTMILYQLGVGFAGIKAALN
jgi:polysaccharide biosynthesis/export protein